MMELRRLQSKLFTNDGVETSTKQEMNEMKKK